ncbi:hypothetical protein KC460_02725 [Candidatus Dependentiae bacterium]|nr:hypothetical protein [Candidatus Dependentiae bacterium]
MAQETFVQKFADILVKQGSIEAKDLETIHVSFADAPQDYFDDFLLEEGLVEESDLLRALSTYYQVPALDVTGQFVDTFLLRKFPKDFLLRNVILPFEVDGDMLIVVANQPEQEGLESAIREYVSYDVAYMVGLRKDITDAIKEFYDRSLTESTDDSGSL